MAAPMRLPSMPPTAAPVIVPSARLPVEPPIALPIAAPAPAPTRVPPTSFGPESEEEHAASAAPAHAIARTRIANLGAIPRPPHRRESLHLLPRPPPGSQTAGASER